MRRNETTLQWPNGVPSAMEAEKLLDQKKFDDLKVHLEQVLPVTQTDIRLFHVYISFLEQTGKARDLARAFEYCWPKVQHHHDAYQFVQRYVTFLLQNVSDSSSEQDYITKTRSIYQASIRNPMREFNRLWKDYETFETVHDRPHARKTLAAQLPVYQKTFRLFSLYKNLLNYTGVDADPIKFAYFFDIIDMERRNVAFLDESIFQDRMNFIFNFFIENHPFEEVFFTKAEFFRVVKPALALSTIKEGINAVNDKMFLFCYYSTLGPDHLFNEALEWFDSQPQGLRCPDVRDSIVINNLSHTLKHKGIEKFRDEFIQALKTEIGPQVFLFVGKTESYVFGEHVIASKILTKGFEKYPDYVPLQEMFLKLLLMNGDMAKARTIFDKFTKTSEITKIMMDHEFSFGSFDKFRDLILLNEPHKTLTRQNDPSLQTNPTERAYHVFKSYINVFEHRDVILEQKIDIFKPFDHLNLPVVEPQAFIEFFSKLSINFDDSTLSEIEE